MRHDVISGENFEQKNSFRHVFIQSCNCIDKIYTFEFSYFDIQITGDPG